MRLKRKAGIRTEMVFLVALLLTACGGGGAAPVTTSTVEDSSVTAPSNGEGQGAEAVKEGAPCSLLTKQEVETVLKATVSDVQETSNGCTYASEEALSAVIMTVYWTGGKDQMEAAKTASGLGESLMEGNTGVDLGDAQNASGIGDEAFFDSVGILHVRQGDAYFDMTSGPMGDRENLKILAARAAARLPGASAEARQGLGEPIKGKPTVAPIERALPATPKRMFKYANLEFTVTKGVITNRSPFDESEYLPDEARLDLTLSIKNPTDDGVGIDAGLFKLKLGDGSVLEEPYDDGVNTRDTEEFALSFEVPPSTTWEGALLTLDQNGKEPATLPLSGPMPTPEYPAELATGGKATVKAPALTYTISKASLDLDADGERVPLGKRYLSLAVGVTSQEKYSTNVGVEKFRLIVDGAPKLSEDQNAYTETVEPTGELEFGLVFLIPTTSQTVELEVGETGKGTARIPLEVGAR